MPTTDGVATSMPPRVLTVKAFGITDKGKVRTANEAAFRTTRRTLTITSEVDVGTTVTLRFPKDRVPAAVAAQLKRA